MTASRGIGKGKGGGRPSLYDPKYNEQAFRLCLLGATDERLAEFFHVSLPTINNWKRDHPKFLTALKEGRDEADAKVSNSLYRRAMGYTHKAVKIFLDRNGRIVRAPYIEHYAPDTTACIFWLKNRQRKNWRNREDDLEVPDGGEVKIVGGLPES